MLLATKISEIVTFHFGWIWPIVGSLVKAVYAEAWTNRTGAAMSSGYGKQVLKNSCATLGAEISRMGSTLPHAKPTVT